jgi:hypothetical protein
MSETVFYPTYLATRPIFSAQKRGKGSSERVLFSGEDFILHVLTNQSLLDSFEGDFEKSNLTVQDQHLLFHIIEYVQKKYGYLFNKEEAVKENFEKYYKERFALLLKSGKTESEAAEIIQKDVSTDFRLGREDYFSTSIKVSDILKELGLKNVTKNRNAIIESFIYLYSLELKFFEIKPQAATEFQAIKKNKNYDSYSEDLSNWFNEHKHNLKFFNLHLRKFIERLSILKNDQTGEILVNFSINKIFLEVLAGKKISFQRFNYSPIAKIKGNSAKLLYIHLTLAPKKVLSEEYLFDILDLKKSRRKPDKLRTVKKAFEELKDFGFSYKYEDGKFRIFNKLLKK